MYININILRSTGLPTTPALSDFGLRVVATLPVAGEHFLLAWNGFTFLSVMILTTSGCYIHYFFKIFKRIAMSSANTGTTTRYQEKATT